jgi:hypothetical protein
MLMIFVTPSALPNVRPDQALRVFNYLLIPKEAQHFVNQQKFRKEKKWSE